MEKINILYSKARIEIGILQNNGFSTGNIERAMDEWARWIQANPLDAQVSFAEPNPQLFTVAEVENYLERQKEICKQQYNLYCTDRGLPISDTCRKMILEAPTPNIVKS